MKHLIAFLLFAPSLCLAQLPDYAPTEGLIAWYNLDGNGMDSGPNELDGNESNTVGDTSRYSEPNGCLYFDGTSHINCGDSHLMNPSYLTIAAWFKLEEHNPASGLSTILGRNLNSGTHRYGYNFGVFGDSYGDASAVGSEGVRFGFETAPDGPPLYDINVSTPIVLGEWTHVVASMDSIGNEVNFYLNGSLIHSEPIFDGPAIELDANTLIGFYRPNGNHSFRGFLDDLGIWNRTLSDLEVLSLFLSSPLALGCTDAQACNFDSSANADNGSCEYGCLYCGEGTVWDSTLAQCISIADTVFIEPEACAPSCGEGTVWDPVNEECIIAIPADLNYDGCVSVNDLLVLLAVHGTCPPYPEWPDEPTDTAWTCGDSLTYWDYDYATALIGDQCWFAENLRTAVYTNGDVIPAGLTDGEWSSTVTGATAVFGESSSSCENYSPDIDACDEAQSLAEYGRLYNWYAVDDGRGLCPSGWHVPSHSELLDLGSFVQIQGFDAGTALKKVDGWKDDESTILGTDDFGFSAVPSGYRHYLSGAFVFAGWNSNLWSSTPAPNNGYYHYFSYNLISIGWFTNSRTMGFSVRCLLDIPLQGCTDSSYIEFNPSAELDDGSCLTPVAHGCTDSLYVEFDPLANVDDGSCLTLAPIEFACGDSISYWGSTYATIMIGNQCWFKDNLKTTRYTDGSPIHPSSNYGAWNTAGIDSIGAYSVYYAGIAQDSVSCSNGQFQSGITEICDSTWVAEHFGYLYNWHVINSPLSLCPPSWHVPSDEEWINFELLLGMSNPETDSVMTYSRGAADSVGFKMFGNTAPEWATYAFQVTDDSNSISCTPSGLMLRTGYSLGAGSTVTYWSSSGNATSPNPESNPFPNAWMRQLDKNQPGVWRTAAPLGNGGYVRCLKDTE